MIIVNLDVMMARRKMSLNELSERVGITIANLSILNLTIRSRRGIFIYRQFDSGEMPEWPKGTVC